MTKITETDIELLAIESLERLGFQFVHGPDIAFDGAPALSGAEGKPERKNYADVILIERLQKAIDKINPTIPQEAKEQALKRLSQHLKIRINLQTTYYFYVSLLLYFCDISVTRC